MESYWNDGKSKQRLILSLGRVGEESEKKLDDLARAISKHRDVLTVTELAKEISVEQTYILGPLLILQKIFERVGINGIADEITKLHPKLELNFLKALYRY
jgi:hypothetical protein